MTNSLPQCLRGLLLSALLAACGSDELEAPIDQGETPAAGCRDGSFTSGALYRTCFPASWNGDLIIYAHGYVAPRGPLQIVDDAIAGTTVSTMVTEQRYAFATTSYRATGLIADVAVQDLVDLEAKVRRLYRPDPGRTFVVGASEGGLVATLAMEQHADRFTGAIAACGPIGDFARQIDWFGDFRVVFDYYFPGVIPGTAADVPDSVTAGWNQRYAPAVAAALLDDPAAARELLRVTGAPADPGNSVEVGTTVLGILWYSAYATANANLRLGGQPYDNATRVYSGSSDDAALNQGVGRFTADPAARAALGRFETSGRLGGRLITLHTTGDPVVPFVHDSLYEIKAAAAGSSELLHRRPPVERYGHCSFDRDDLLGAFFGLFGIPSLPSQHSSSR